MIHKLLEAIRVLMSPRWDRRLPVILARARNLSNIPVTSEEAYLAGYRDGYWEGVSDFIEARLDQRRDEQIAITETNVN